MHPENKALTSKQPNRVFPGTGTHTGKGTGTHTGTKEAGVCV